MIIFLISLTIILITAIIVFAFMLWRLRRDFGLLEIACAPAIELLREFLKMKGIDSLSKSGRIREEMPKQNPIIRKPPQPPLRDFKEGQIPKKPKK